MSDLPPIMSVAEAAEYARLSAKTVYDLIADRKIRAKKVGSRLLIRREWLIEWMERDDQAQESA